MILGNRLLRIHQLDDAILEAKRFVQMAEEAKASFEREPRNSFKDVFPDFAAAKRASLDLARSMLKLRKPL